MGMFDFRDYTSKKSVELIETSHQLAVSSIMRPLLGDGALASVLDSVMQSSLVSGSPKGSIKLPDGWRAMTAAELNIDPKNVDSLGYFTMKSPAFNAIVPGGIQAKVYVDENPDGSIARLTIAWAGTNSITDIPDYFKFFSPEMVEAIREFTEKVADFAMANGVPSKDVIVTGYSLGGAMTTIMAENQNDLAGGYFSDANFISHDGPLHSDADNYFNFGYENDIVYRATGGFKSIEGALEAAGPLLKGSDFNLKNSADNVVLFDGAYASPLFPFGPFSILNIAGGWYAHVDGVLTDAIERITASEFYNLTERDSAVIVSNLGADLRWSTWVEDKKTLASSDHFGKSAFLIGTTYNDKLRDGAANDMIDGMGGDDLVRVSTGYDLVHGGGGTDTLRLRGDAKDWDVFKLNDGSLAFVSETDGVKIATDVEKIQFEGWAIGNVSLFNKTYLVHSDELYFEGSWWDRLWNSDKAYSQAGQGTGGADNLTGQIVFALGGDDKLTGTEANDLLVGGAGQDTVSGGAGNDRLYGGAHNDRIHAGDGNDLMNGGHGDDVFVFDGSMSGSKTIQDFNRATDQDDVLEFSGLFTGFNDVMSAASQVGDDVRIQTAELTIILEDTTLDSLSADDMVFVLA